MGFGNIMNNTISEEKAYRIIQEFLYEIRAIDDHGILALYVIGSLGGGYYRPGRSDIDTIIIVRDNAVITQPQTDDIAEKYHKKYDVPKGFGSVLIHEAELSSPYTKSETDELEFTVEIARLKTQGKAIYNSIALDRVQMPTREDFIKDALIMERWFHKEFGYPMFDKLKITGCINCILGCMRRYLMIEKGIFEFNKFKTIDVYLKNDPPLEDKNVFNIIQRELKGEILVDDSDLSKLQVFGIKFRDYFNQRLLNVDSRTV